MRREDYIALLEGLNDSDGVVFDDGVQKLSQAVEIQDTLDICRAKRHGLGRSS